MVLGIDLAGIVETSSHPGFSPGDEVIVNGYGLSETHFGGYAEKARVKGDWLVKLPAGLTRAEAMAIGTAGYTAMLCVMAIERHGLTPASGPALVTGAAGGVGSTAISLLAGKGWKVIASTGRAERGRLSARASAPPKSSIARRSPRPASRSARSDGRRPSTASVRTRSPMSLAQTRYGGAVAACGLAGGMDLPTTVAPFILRGVTLLGIDSVNCPMPLRLEAWRRLAHDLDRQKLAAMTETIPFDNVFEAGRRILEGKMRGRIVVSIG